MQNTRESQLHQFGKMVFEGAEGKTMGLPPSPHPRFTPPVDFTIERVEIEKGIPWAGWAGRRPDIVLTSPDGRKLVVEVKNTSGKGPDYSRDLEKAGFWLAVELDVSAWEKHPEKRPDFSSRSMLQDVAGQFRWLMPGRPAALLEWEEYSLPYRVYDKDLWLSWVRESREVNLASYGRAEHMDLWSCEMIPHGVNSPWAAAVQSPECPPPCLQVEGLGLLSAATYRYEPPGIPRRMWPFYIGEDVETGWVLHRNGVPLPEYQVRSLPAGHYQAVWTEVSEGDPSFYIGSYLHKLDRVVETRDASLFHFQGELVENRVWPIRPTWKKAVQDIFAHLVPGATPTFQQCPQHAK